MDISSLSRKRSYYRNMRENVIYMINTLKNYNVMDNISVAMSNLKQSYNVNNYPYKYNELSKLKNSISQDINTLTDVLYYINVELEKITNDLTEAERQ